MNFRVLIAAFVGAIVMFALGFVIFGVALSGFIQANSNMGLYPGLLNDPPNFVALGLSNLAFAWVYAFIFDQWAGVKTFVGGALAGIAISIPLTLAIDLQYLAFMNIYKNLLPILVDVIGLAVMNAITGGVMGLVIGKMSPKS